MIIKEVPHFISSWGSSFKFGCRSIHFEKLRIGFNTTRDTLKITTTQQDVQQAVHPITRRYRTDTMSLKVCQLKAIVFTDTGSLIGDPLLEMYVIKAILQKGSSRLFP